MDITADDFVTRITEAPDAQTADMILMQCRISTLREVADLIYACDSPETQSRSFLRKAILAEARGLEAEL